MKITLPSEPDIPRVLLFGIDCHFTHQILDGLIRRGVTVVAIALPGPPNMVKPITVKAIPSGIRLADDPGAAAGVLTIAARHHIPVYRVGDLRSRESHTFVDSLQADTLVCACFPRIIQREFTNLFPSCAVNIHPSLLPDKRGPDPLFWTFREGSGRSGVTIHDLSPRYDAGGIVSQRAHIYPDGTSETDLETALAAIAVELLCEQPVHDFPRSVQDESAATYAPFPTEDDYALDLAMSARSAFNFVRGVRARGVPITVEYEGRILRVADIHAFRSDEPQPARATTTLRFADGYLRARLIPHSS